MCPSVGCFGVAHHRNNLARRGTGSKLRRAHKTNPARSVLLPRWPPRASGTRSPDPAAITEILRPPFVADRRCRGPIDLAVMSRQGQPRRFGYLPLWAVWQVLQLELIVFSAAAMALLSLSSIALDSAFTSAAYCLVSFFQSSFSPLGGSNSPRW